MSYHGRIGQGWAFSRDVLEHLTVELRASDRDDLPLMLVELERIKVEALMKLTTPPTPAPDEYLTVAQVAGRLHLSRSFIYELTRRGELPSHQLGRGQRGRRIRLADLVIWERGRAAGVLRGVPGRHGRAPSRHVD